MQKDFTLEKVYVYFEDDLKDALRYLIMFWNR